MYLEQKLDARPCWGPQGTRIAPWLFVVMMNDIISHGLGFEQVSTVKILGEAFRQDLDVTVILTLSLRKLQSVYIC